MLERGFLQSNSGKNTKHHKIASTASKTLLYVGAIILLVSFIYLLSNLDKADKLIGMLIPFMVAGLGFILVSQLIKRSYKRLR